MSFTFSDLQTEVKARAILSESSTNYDTQVKNAINTSLFRIARDGKWRVLRRTSTFDTVAEYTTGSGAVSVTNGSKSVTITGATLITDGIYTGRLITIGSGQTPYTIATITGETTLTLDRNYSGTSSATETYVIYGQDNYTLNIQASRVSMLWHENYGYPYEMGYVTDVDFYRTIGTRQDRGTPIFWRQWGFGSAINQPRQAGVVSVASSATADTSKDIIVYGTVSGYPDQETITTNGSDGTTVTAGTKSFSYIERVTKASTTTGRITVTADSAATTISVLPVGDGAGMTELIPVQIFPYPNSVFPINVLYYKAPYRLVNDNDIHEFGHEFDEAIILLATSKLNYSQDKTSGDKFLTLYLDEIKNLRKHNMDIAMNWMPHLRSGIYGGSRYPHKYVRYSQLGGSYGPQG